MCYPQLPKRRAGTWHIVSVCSGSGQNCPFRLGVSHRRLHTCLARKKGRGEKLCKLAVKGHKQNLCANEFFAVLKPYGQCERSHITQSARCKASIVRHNAPLHTDSRAAGHAYRYITPGIIHANLLCSLLNSCKHSLDTVHCDAMFGLLRRIRVANPFSAIHYIHKKNIYHCPR
jgi:hypothetical protein